MCVESMSRSASTAGADHLRQRVHPPRATGSCRPGPVAATHNVGPRGKQQCQLHDAEQFGGVKPAAAGPTGLKEGRLLRRMHAVLHEMPPERRLAALRMQFSEPQRLALERWMLAERATRRMHSSTCDAFSTGPRKSSRAKRLGSATTAFGAPPVAALPQKDRRDQRRPARGDQQKRGVKRPRDVPMETAKPTEEKLWSWKSGAGISGILKNQQLQGCFYTAQITLGSLQLMSKADRSLSAVLGFRDVLLAIRRRTAEGHGGSFEQRFREAVSTTLAEVGPEAGAMGLRFKVSLSLLWASRRLSTRAWPLTSPEPGLRARRMLREARGGADRGRQCVLRDASPGELAEAWERLCHAYRAVMAEARCRQGAVEARLASIHREQLAQQERHLEVWNRERMASEDKQPPSASRAPSWPAARAGARTPEEAPQKPRQVRSTAEAEQAIEHLLRRWNGLVARQRTHHRWSLVQRLAPPPTTCMRASALQQRTPDRRTVCRPPMRDSPVTKRVGAPAQGVGPPCPTDPQATCTAAHRGGIPRCSDEVSAVLPPRK
uniref:Uncharacterized protein n=1 Tax=Alexandrium monilatum TaxID=311494 RepID=A0A7S4PTQ4_9DINO